ncbi:DUF916 and DUF3324 domain-containing protein [Vagococcus carniphilus]|nr:DUF916 and DUF3324 domain-containing protein [Vagococcus carniphilus]QNN72461.1 DUF916 and DUF3324 domain-containing protein [Vagococcus carniphilus]
MSKRYLTTIGIILLFLIGIRTEASELNFSVASVIPENQVDKSKTYFDLMVKPNEEQKIAIEINNTSNKEITVIPTISNATTNLNGVVEYTLSKDKLNKGTPVEIEEILTLPENQKEVKVPKNVQSQLILNLKMPKEKFDGIVAGGITLQEKKEEKTDEDENKGMTIKNYHAYTIAVLVREEKKDYTPELELENVKVGQQNYRNVILTKLKNPVPDFLNELETNSTVTKKGESQVLYTSEKKNMQMAPNSSFQLPIPIEDKMKPGTYTLKMTAKSSDKKWEFVKDFSIGEKEARKFNEADVTLPKDNNKLIIIGLSIAILVLILIILLLTKNKKKQKKMTKKKKRKKK